jgi:hypothetical protein
MGTDMLGADIRNISQQDPRTGGSCCRGIPVVCQFSDFFSYPAMMEFSATMTFAFYGIMSILSALFVWKMVPETKGKSLEEMEKLWGKKK